LAQLQTPELVYFQGALRPWRDAVLHVSTEAVNRGLNVFEGIKGYWGSEGREFGLVAVREHYDRLHRSARLLHIPFTMPFDEFEGACHELVGALLTPERDMWVRATLFVVEGHWGEGTRADLVLTAYHQERRRPDPIAVGVSTWRRAVDVALPARIKTSTNYQVARLARIEGRGRGFADMILLNRWDRVAEATGACLLMVRDGAVFTPPASEGVLESITVDIVEALAESVGIPFVRRPVDRTELYVADELALAGTLAELVPVRRIDDHRLPDELPVVEALADRFWGAVRGDDPHPAVRRSVLPEVPAVGPGGGGRDGS
jgi:branched-chain amino acid aminotransferase